MIDVADLRFAYGRSASPAVDGLNFSLAPGEILGFLGPSGAGKSTTQKILIGLLQGYQGQVRVLGQELRDWRPEHYERIGVGFETPNHFLKLTAIENLRYFQALYSRPGRDPMALLRAVGLEQDGQRRVETFSKGMRVRFGVVRSLLCQPDLLFLDEPTSGLDPVNSRRVLELIQAERAAGRSIFLTTHDMAVAEALCDRVAFLVDGRIACIDTPQALKLSHGERSVRLRYQDQARIAERDFALDGLADNDEFLGLLRHGEVLTLHSREASLSEVFIRVTGRSLA